MIRNKLKKRADGLKKVRSFFDKRDIIEVDTPMLSPKAPVDAYIDIFEVHTKQKRVGFLSSSPEYRMKELLSKGSGDIYQLSHVYRCEEEGCLHNPEFTMIEWYRLGFSFEQMISETCDLIDLFFEAPLKRETKTYRQVFYETVGLDYLEASDDALSKKAESGDTREEHLHYLWATHAEPTLGKDCLTIIIDFPSTQAALAQIKSVDGIKVAKRFEVSYQGIELANGFLELSNPEEQLVRFEKENALRHALGKNELPIDMGLIEALERGLPPCCGVAVGFDRLLLLQTGAGHIREVLYPFLDNGETPSHTK